MANSADSGQFDSLEAILSGSALFAKAGYIRVQNDKLPSKIHSRKRSVRELNEIKM